MSKFTGGQLPPYKTVTKPDSVIYDETTHKNVTRKANAAFVVLARNGDLKGILASMKQMEDRFNKKYNYPWVFLNEEPFSDDFKKYYASLIYPLCSH